MMTPRPLARTRRVACKLLLASAGLLLLAGCDPRALLYFLQPFEPTIPPSGPSLKGKKVVVLTHATSSATSDFRSIDRELTREFVKILREKVKRIDVIEPQRVWDWVDAHPSWSEPAEAARAFDADMVIFLELEGFQIQDPSSPQLFKGLAKTHVQVTELAYPKNSKGKPQTDKPKEPDVIFDEIRDSEFPSRGHMEMDANVSRSGFKNKFVKLVAMEISWYFTDRAYGDDIQDTRVSE